jgi:NAD(P)-dependent dehydrogenase (short-subunit alcohol dehydrogenase family)
MDKKIALVCGGVRGIGRNIVDKLADNDYKVYVFDYILSDFQNADISLIHIDLRDILNVINEIEKIYKLHNNIETVIYNARAGSKLNFLDETIENFNISFDVMVKAPFFIAQRIGQLKKISKQNTITSIINISSIASSFIGSESPSYHMAKAAIENMTRYIAKHGGKYNIRMNAIAPGFIVQDEHLERFYSDDNVAFRTIANEIHPLKSIGNSDDIANMVLFLSSEKSKFINGQTIIIDGGLTIQDSWDLVYKSGFE